MEATKSMLKDVTVEPILFLFGLSASFQWPTMDALIYRKVCLSNFNESICDNLNNLNYSREEDVVQSETSHWYLANNLCFEIPSIITSLFYGNLSDQFSRKMALQLPLIGQMITLAVFILNAIFMTCPVQYILIGPVLSGIFGGWISCNLAAYSYLSEVSTENSRSIRIAIGESMSSTSIALGFLISGVTLDHTSFAFVLSLSFCLFILAFLYATYYITDLKVSQTLLPAISSGSRCCHQFKSVCSLDSIKQAVTVIFIKREGQKRIYILILLFGMLCGILTGSASWLIGYLFLRRQPLSWTQSLYGYYVGYGAAIHGISLILIMPFFKRYLHMADTSILLLSVALQAAAEALFAFCTSTWMVFMVPIVGFFQDARSTCSRALLSNLVQRKELGKIFAVVGSLQSIGMLLGAAIYNYTYPLTLAYWSGLCFVAGAAFTVIPLALVGWVHLDMKKRGKSAILDQTSLGIADREGSEDELLLLQTYEDKQESDAQPNGSIENDNESSELLQ